MKTIPGKSVLKMVGGMGTVIGAFLGMNGLYNWYNQKTLEDISGNWKLNYTIEETSYAPYKGIQLGYTIFIEQHGNAIKGNGDKTYENGQPLPSAAKTPIEVNGTFDGENILLTVKEKGKKRESSGMIQLKVGDHAKKFEGTFTTTAANSTGKCVVELIK